jgi:hypothetical protein
VGAELLIRLVGFAGYEASERFLRALDDEIHVARTGRAEGNGIDVNIERPLDIRTENAMKRALEVPCDVLVLSAHAGFDDGIYFSGEGDPAPYVRLNSLAHVGAKSAFFLDTCYFRDLIEPIRNHVRCNALLVGVALKGPTFGRHSVSLLADVLRELCYAEELRLSAEAVRRAVGEVNRKQKRTRPAVVAHGY